MLPSSLNIMACGLLRRTARRAALPDGLPAPVTLPSVFFRFSRTYMAVLALPRRQRPPRQAVPCRCLSFTRLSGAGDDAERLREAAPGRAPRLPRLQALLPGLSSGGGEGRLSRFTSTL